MKKVKYFLLSALFMVIMPMVAKAATLKVGDYVEMTPTKTSYTISSSSTGYDTDQTINPSELKLWRIIDIHSDGSFDAVSEYVSSTDVYLKGAVGYANFVGLLNTIAAQYQNSEYTIGARHMGYDGQTEYITNTSAFDGSQNTTPEVFTTDVPTTGTGVEYSGGVLGDTLYLKDYQLVGNVYKSDTSTYGSTGLKAYDVSATSAARPYWLASRGYRYLSLTDFFFYGRDIRIDGSLEITYMRSFDSGWGDGSFPNRFRPILTLKSGLTVSGGSGTKASPYTLR